MTTIRLCAVCAAHAPAIEYYVADPAIAATTGAIPHPYPVGGGDAFVKQAMAEWCAGTSRIFCILVDHLEAGVVGLDRIDIEHGSASLGIWVARPYWGRGIGTRAVDQILDYAGEHLGLDAVWSCCVADNVGSRRMHEKAGFEHLGAFVGTADDGRHAGATMLRFRRAFTAAGAEQDDPRGLVLDSRVA